jgi:hypothetical protein
MSRPGLMEGVAVALAAAAGGTVLYSALVPFLGAPTAIRTLVPLLGLLYLLYLLSRTGERIGRVTTVAAWLAVAAAAWLLELPLSAYVLAHLGAIWLVRSLYFHPGMLAALADLGLTTLALAAGMWAAQRTGSLFLTLWSVFLIQALFVAIPPRVTARSPRPRRDGEAEDVFDRAHRAGEAAVRRLSSPR